MMHEHIRHLLLTMSVEEFNYLNQRNDLRISHEEIQQFYHLLHTSFSDIIDEATLSVCNEQLLNRMSVSNISKYHELITTIKRNIILNKS